MAKTRLGQRLSADVIGGRTLSDESPKLVITVDYSRCFALGCCCSDGLDYYGKQSIDR